MPPYPEKGYWADMDCLANFTTSLSVTNGVVNTTYPAWDEFRECTPVKFGEGGPDSACAPGHHGPLCHEVNEGWFSVGKRFWYPCAGAGTTMSIVTIIAVIVMLVFISKVAAGQYDALDVALLYIQVRVSVSVSVRV